LPDNICDISVLITGGSIMNKSTFIHQRKISNEARPFWESHIKKWDESNLSQHAYCQQAGLKYGTFVYWRSILLDKKRDDKPSFIPVKVIDQQPSSSVNSTSIKIKLPNGLIVSIPSSYPIKDMVLLINQLGMNNA
jgi:hypothetical protein